MLRCSAEMNKYVIFSLMVEIPCHTLYQESRRSEGWHFYLNKVGDKLLLNFGAKFQLSFIISDVKLQCCHGNFSGSAKMASYGRYLSSMILIANAMVYS